MLEICSKRDQASWWFVGMFIKIQFLWDNKNKLRQRKYFHKLSFEVQHCLQALLAVRLRVCDL